MLEVQITLDHVHVPHAIVPIAIEQVAHRFSVQAFVHQKMIHVHVADDLHIAAQVDRLVLQSQVANENVVDALGCDVTLDDQPVDEHLGRVELRDFVGFQHQIG
uniref:(northern house mosquito) hypothetical protein n=1 Tax=Culex pipiens TaxID=7175 RepID=A0A8D8FLZ0_CULPI